MGPKEAKGKRLGLKGLILMAQSLLTLNSGCSALSLPARLSRLLELSHTTSPGRTLWVRPGDWQGLTSYVPGTGAEERMGASDPMTAHML